MADEKKIKQEFVGLITQNQRMLYSYILSLGPKWGDADDILQKTHVRLWEEFDGFESGTNFTGWAMKIAYYEVLTWRKSASRNKLIFDQTLIDQLSECQLKASQNFEERRSALETCVDQLSEQQRNLIGRCYVEGAKIKDVAEDAGRSVEAVYKSLQRLRLALHHCIEERLRKGGLA